ncbi:MAG: DUF4148 domain-containing protein [Burkholderiaceae bacterium]
MSIRTTTLLALLATALIIPVSSFAQWVPDNGELGGHDVVNTTSMKTHAQVLQELQQAKADPSWASRQGEETGSWADTSIQPEKTRAQVTQELQSVSPKQHAYQQSFYTGA